MLSDRTAVPVGQPRILVTGVDPFGGQPVNPSWLAVQAPHGRELDGHRIVGAQLPTAFGRSLQELLGQHCPALVVGLEVGIACALRTHANLRLQAGALN